MESENNRNKALTEKPKGWGTRHTTVCMLFLAMFIHQCLRVNVSVAIVAMVKNGKELTKKVVSPRDLPYGDIILNTFIG
jgi:hypothetical protein